jgi:predicted phosphoribosyltransferase
MFRNRADAARQLAEKLHERKLNNPLVLAIPRGGVVTGAVLAQELGTELDVILSRKLRAPGQPELAIGAISEDGQIYLNHHAQAFLDGMEEYLALERNYQMAEIARRKKLFRAVRPRAQVAGCSVVVTDDGIATGSTMIAALQTVKTQKPREVIVAVPVASPDRLAEVRRWCDVVVCLLIPEEFWAIGQFYEDFTPVEDEEVIELLREFTPTARLFDPSTDRVEQHDKALFGDVDLLDLSATHVLAHGRTVYAVEPAQVPSDTGVAAILCHPLPKHQKRP